MNAPISLDRLIKARPVADFAIAICLVAALASAAVSGANPFLPATPPDIVFVLIDDLGPDQVASHPRSQLASTLTPHLDALALEGLWLTHLYSLPVCSATRRALLTGVNPAHHGGADVYTWPDRHVFGPDFTTEIALPVVLASAGYTTAAFGKWHLGGPLMEEEGEWVDNVAGAGWSDWLLWHQNLYGKQQDPDYPDAGYFEHRYHSPATGFVDSTDYAPDILTDAAIDWWSATPGPRFMYVAHHLVHTPKHCPVGVSCTSDAERHEAMLLELDDQIDRLLDIVRAASPDAWIVIAGDNGSEAAHILSPWTPGRAKGSVYAGGTESLFLLIAPGVTPGARAASAMFSDLYASLAELAQAPLPSPLPAGLESTSIWGVLDPAWDPTDRIAYVDRWRPNGLGDWQAKDLFQVAVTRWPYRVVFDREAPADERWQLYDLAQDPAELTDLMAAGMPPLSVAEADALGWCQAALLDRYLP